MVRESLFDGDSSEREQAGGERKENDYAEGQRRRDAESRKEKVKRHKI